MADNIPDELKQMFLEAEEEAFGEIPDMSLDELVMFYKIASVIVLNDAETLKNVAETDNEFRPEIFFSIFSFIKGLLAEIEYRIRAHNSI